MESETSEFSSKSSPERAANYRNRLVIRKRREREERKLATIPSVADNREIIDHGRGTLKANSTDLSMKCWEENWGHTERNF